MKKVLSTILTMLVLSLFTQPVIAGPATGNSYLIDFVVLNENKTIDDRKKYERHMAPILKKYGAEKEQAYVLNQHMAGQLKGASLLNIYKMKNADTLAAIGKDPDYKKLADLRNSIHDMSKLTLYLGEPLRNIGQIKSKFILVDLVVMNDGFGHPERFNYENKMGRIASKYGAEIVNSFDIDKKLKGIGPEAALKLNIWAMPTPEAMQQLSSDPEYLKLKQYRNQIHNMDAITLYMASPTASCIQCVN